ncbi:MAG: hypothetical protein EOO22_19490 [Comamonadaceae bacterium]|nr:MAG: hypothetical protein EOO22_19490 [Comamonadaceae bacterium]
MLEVVQHSVAQDATYIAELAGAMEAFAVRTGETELMLPIDPGGRSRETLQLSAEKGRALCRAALHTAKLSPTDLAPVHTLVAMALKRLVSICEVLHEAVRKHDLPFEGGEVAGSQRALA